MLLEGKDLSFRYADGGRELFSQVNLSITSKERVGLLAPSGAGKTTLCKLLAGYEQPKQGNVLLDNRPLSDWEGYCPVQMIWQHPEQVLNPKLRMRRVVEEAGGVHPRIMKALGIAEEWLTRFPRELSGGELQRICIARALGEHTKFLLADEITAMLDLPAQSEIWNFLIKETQQRGIGMLVVGHSSSLLDRVCTRLIEKR